MASWVFVNIGTGNDLLPDGTKPISDPMLTHYHFMWHSSEGIMIWKSEIYKSAKQEWKFLWSKLHPDLLGTHQFIYTILSDAGSNIFVQVVETYQVSYWSQNKMAAILQMPFSNAFSWIKISLLQLHCLWSLFLWIISACDYTVPSAKYAWFCWWTQKHDWHL